MENRNITKQLYTTLTDGERLDFTATLVEKEGQLLSKELEKKSTVDMLNADMKEIESGMHEIFGKLRINSKLSEVECEELVDEGTKQVITRRLDTMEVIDVRKMLFEELQHDMVFDEIEYAESTVQRDNDALTQWLAEIESDWNSGHEEMLIGREVSDREVKSWIPEQYRLVENWALLVKYYLDNPDKGVQIGEVPEILLNPVDLGPEEEEGPIEETNLSIMVDGTETLVAVQKNHIPEGQYQSATFYPETAVVTFWDSKGDHVAECLGRIVEPDEPAEPDDEFSDTFQFEIEGDMWTVGVKPAAVPKEWTELEGVTCEFDRGKVRVTFNYPNGDKIKSVKAKVIAQEPIEPDPEEGAAGE